MNRYEAVILFGAFISSVSQILLKISADAKHARPLSEYLNWRVALAYGLFFLAVLLNIYAFRGVELKAGPVLASSTYIFVMILGSLFLGERVTWRKLLGNVLIVLGILVFNRA